MWLRTRRIIRSFSILGRESGGPAAPCSMELAGSDFATVRMQTLPADLASKNVVSLLSLLSLEKYHEESEQYVIVIIGSEVTTASCRDTLHNLELS